MKTHSDNTTQQAAKTTANSTPAALSQQAAGKAEPNVTTDAVQLKEMANNNPQVSGLRTLQAMANSRPANNTPPIQRKENSTGLPDQLKSGIENLSGYALDDVKVHYNSSEPAQLQAHAYAQGTDIHVAPGQEQHLPHEAWHVVQQKQNRVQATTQLKHTAINDNRALEQEADTMGAKALALPAQLQSAKPLIQTAHTNSPLIQRKMGFEFETDYTFELWKNEAWEAVGRTKDKPFYTGAGFKIEGDTHDNCEFILDPFENKPDAVAAITAAEAFATDIDTKFADGYAVAEAGGNWKNKTRIKNNASQWEADAQVTQGVALADLPHYIKDHMNREEEEVYTEAMGNAGMAGGLNAGVKGLVSLIIKFVLDFKDWDGAYADEGPKNAQAWMARTKYIEMAKSLSAGNQTQFKSLFFTAEDVWKRDNPVTSATGVAGGTKVIPNRYSTGETDEAGEDITTGEPTTLKQWLEELCEGSNDSDKMSPPAGWRGGNYGMGLMDMDEESSDKPLALLEYRQTDNREERGEISGKKLPATEWKGYVEAQFDKALLWNSTLKNNEEEAD